MIGIILIILIVLYLFQKNDNCLKEAKKKKKKIRFCCAGISIRIEEWPFRTQWASVETNKIIKICPNST